MTDFTPTEEQQSILKAAKSDRNNLIIQALAGSGKTATLGLIADELWKDNILTLAFNKRIATEMQEKLPPNCRALTLNSLGHRVWGEQVGCRLSIDTRKNYNILKDLIKRLTPAEQDDAWECMSETLKMFAAAKTYGYIPDGHFPQAKPLMNDSDFFASLILEPTALQERLLQQGMVESIKQARKGLMDFDDQILMPTVFSSLFPKYDTLLVDEAQDLSALNHAMLRKAIRGGRLIGVGDSCQAIYAFRGAEENSMSLLKQEFSMDEFTLSISFRCPKKVVEAARWRAPHMKWPEWAKEGSVQSLTEWNKDNVPDSAAIICRNNAPIFGLALKLLRDGRYPKILGNDITKGIVKTLKTFGDNRTPQAELHNGADEWLKKRLIRSREPEMERDKANCLRIFINEGSNLAEALTYAEHITMMEGPIQMMTGHKSKGLEFSDVLILDKHLVRTDRGGKQEKNLLYVMQTRALENLTYVDSDTFVEAS